LAQKSDYEYVHTARGLGYRFEARPKGLAESEVHSAAEYMEPGE